MTYLGIKRSGLQNSNIVSTITLVDRGFKMCEFIPGFSIISIIFHTDSIKNIAGFFNLFLYFFCFHLLNEIDIVIYCLHSLLSLYRLTFSQ